jgi:hypothetical protein
LYDLSIKINPDYLREYNSQDNQGIKITELSRYDKRM